MRSDSGGLVIESFDSHNKNLRVSSVKAHCSGTDFNEDEWIQILKRKADKTDITQLAEEKTNKFDFE